MSAAVRSPRKKLTPDGLDSEDATTKYSLRGSSRLPSRYRDDEQFIQPTRNKRSTTTSPKKSPVKRFSTNGNSPSTYLQTSRLNMLAKSAIEEESASNSSSSSLYDQRDGRRQPARRALKVSPQPSENGEPIENSNNFPIKKDVDEYDEDDDDEGEDEEDEDEEDVEDMSIQMPIQDTGEWVDMQTFFNMFTSDYEREEMMKQFSSYKSKTQKDVSRLMRSNLKKLYNMLKYKKARQWIICEFFYSGVDKQIFMGENEFASIIKESFPNLKTWLLNKTEWRTMRGLLGKPRRCSSSFFEEERMYLEEKRLRIRSVYEGSFLNDPSIDLKDLPAKLPKQLVVGNRVYARVRQPRDGVYAGIIDAVIPNGYRIVFEKKDLPATLVRDTEVIIDGPSELLSIAYFIEQANSKLPTGVRPFVSAVRDTNRPNLLKDELVSRPFGDKTGPLNGPNDTRLNNRNAEMVGNFPLRFLVNLVKLTKLIEIKKGLVKQLTELNTEAEIKNLTTSKYSDVFQEKYAKVIIDLEHVNQNISTNMEGIQEHHMYFSSSNDVLKPESIRRLCFQQAGRFVEHCNQGLNVENVHALTLIQSLTAILLQVRALGSKKLSAVDLISLNDSINSIKTQISPKNEAFFQDYVEVHMKQFHSIMVENGTVSSLNRR